MLVSGACRHVSMLGGITRGLGIVCWNVVRQVSGRRQGTLSICSRQRLVGPFSHAGDSWQYEVRLRTNGIDAMFSLLPRKRGRAGRHGAESSIMHVLIIACNSDYVVVAL